MSVKQAAVIFLGAAAMLAWQSDRDPGGRDLHGAPARAALCVLAGLCLLAAGWLYRLLFGPLELIRKPDDVGYITEDGKSRARAANEVRRRRKTGDLPPVYPNGWYRVLDSHLLQRGEVRSVSVLGRRRAGSIHHHL